MTEQETKITDSTQQEASAQENLQEKEQTATQPAEETEEQSESAVSGDTEKGGNKAGALVGAAKAIEDGMGFVGEKAPEVASFVLHKVKRGVSAAYGTSQTLVRDAYHTAGDYADKYKHKNEIRKLKAQREATTSRLGSAIYTKVIVDGEAPEKTLAETEITSLLQQIQDLDNEVIKIGKELEKE